MSLGRCWSGREPARRWEPTVSILIPFLACGFAVFVSNPVNDNSKRDLLHVIDLAVCVDHAREIS